MVVKKSGPSSPSSICSNRMLPLVSVMSMSFLSCVQRVGIATIRGALARSPVSRLYRRFVTAQCWSLQ